MIFNFDGPGFLYMKEHPQGGNPFLYEIGLGAGGQ
jgi:hypothetical protein